MTKKLTTEQKLMNKAWRHKMSLIHHLQFGSTKRAIYHQAQMMIQIHLLEKIFDEKMQQKTEAEQLNQLPF